MGFPLSLNFRSTTAFKTPEGAGENAVISSPEASSGNGITYPTSVSGVNMGWGTGNVATRDLSTTPSVEFAGSHFNESNGTEDFRIDLPAAGSYTIRLASGYYSGGFLTKVELFDDTTSLGVLCNGTTSGSDKFLDATGVEYSSAAWPAGNTSVTKTFSTTVCKIRVGNGSTTTGFLAHLEIALAAASPNSGVVVVRTVPGGAGGTMTLTRTAP